MQPDVLADELGRQDVALDELADQENAAHASAGMCQSGQNCTMATPTASTRPVSEPT